MQQNLKKKTFFNYGKEMISNTFNFSSKATNVSTSIQRSGLKN